ncbi:NAD(P)H-dependent flavin oxidoreductase [Candidatus Protochlamydia phocaeensis]|uniref:NAD(P)H-dependent flavin oxidoreductase n=1 Tax=Candidatus Protochlamydia phocaeensis TaxID=1414722 RepID=UPI0008393744|nr:DUF561 domain-containing protein [Candidatus Protochlamydia phocaeensis]
MGIKANHLVSKLNIKYPIVQAPMAGGPSTPALAAAVSNAGGLGSLGVGYLSPADIRQEIRKTRTLTSAPFAVNLFIQPNKIAIEDEPLEKALHLLDPYKKELGLSNSLSFPQPFAEDYEKQIEAVLSEQSPIFSFTFGIPAKEIIKECKEAGIILIGTATHIEEAQALEEAGIDIICAQGGEAGGHRGTFIGEAKDALIGTLSLIPQLVDAVRIPVLASGGIMDGRGIVAALALGASGVQMGTAFLLCPESGSNAGYRTLLNTKKAYETAVTRAFSGRAARGIKNRFIIEMEEHEADIPPYPIQNALTKEIRQAAVKQGRFDLLSIWAGQAAGLIRQLSAAQLIEHLVLEMERTLHQLHRL